MMVYRNGEQFNILKENFEDIKRVIGHTRIGILKQLVIAMPGKEFISLYKIVFYEIIFYHL